MLIPPLSADSGEPQLGGLKTSIKWGVLAAIAVACFSIFLPNYYLSEARILPVENKNSGGLGQLAAAAAAIGVGIPGQDSGDANFVDILTSRSIKEDLLNTEFQFHSRSWRFGAEQSQQQTLFRFLKCKNMDEAVRKLGKVISAKRDLKSKILTVSAETISPELSQEIVQKATDGLEKFVMGKGRTKGSQKARFAEERLKDARVEVTKAEGLFREFLELNRNYQASTDPTVRLRGLELEAEYKLRQQLVMTQSITLEQALLEEKNDIPVVNILDRANLPIEKSSPKRSILMLLAFFVVTSGAWAWRYRCWIWAHMKDTGDDELEVVAVQEAK